MSPPFAYVEEGAFKFNDTIRCKYIWSPGFTDIYEMVRTTSETAT